MAELNNIALIEKIVRAKVELESMKKAHSPLSCALFDPGLTTCTCGASEVNDKVDHILKTLSLES